jgi:hypothetical protein
MGRSISLSDIENGRTETIDLLAACDAQAAESTEFLCGISQISHVYPAGGGRRADLMSLLASAHGADLQRIGTEAGLLVDPATSVAVAEWSYGHAERVQAEVWLGGTDYGHLSAGWRGLLA